MTNEYELTDLGATEYGALVRDAKRWREGTSPGFLTEAAMALCAEDVRRSFKGGVILADRFERRTRNYWRKRADRYMRQAEVVMQAMYAEAK